MMRIAIKNYSVETAQGCQYSQNGDLLALLSYHAVKTRALREKGWPIPTRASSGFRQNGPSGPDFASRHQGSERV